uniref:Dirigent protein n=1 Tax=Oryza nivara TaxID=4536 RepID=A0A0E0I4L0_ORYNI
MGLVHGVSDRRRHLPRQPHLGERRPWPPEQQQEELRRRAMHGDEDILYDFSNSTSNSTSAAATKPTPLSTAVSSPGYFFGRVVVFNDPMTEGRALPPSLEETARDKKDDFSAWFAFSVVFNSTAHRGTLNLMGANPNAATRDISVVGGTGDFFMSRGVATLRTDAIEGFKYFRAGW